MMKNHSINFSPMVMCGTTVKFTVNYLKQTVSFFGVTTEFKQRAFVTQLYRKPSDKAPVFMLHEPPSKVSEK